MVDHVVSAKLNEKEHAKILEICKRHGYTTSRLIKEAIAKWAESEGVQKESSRPSVLQKLTGKDAEHEAEISINDYLQYFRKRVEFGKHDERLDDSS